MKTLMILSLLAAAASLAHSSPGRVRSILPRSSAPERTLLYADLLAAPHDVRLALTVLQGLVNRERPRLYLLQDPGWHGPSVIPKWVEGLKERGYRLDPVTDPLSLVRTFHALVKGAALYEPDLERAPASLHKLNALTLYCAVNDALPVTPELNARLGLPVLFDARAKLSTGEEAYSWMYRELWPRANHHLLAHTCPTHVVLRDYLVAHRIAPFWISAELSWQGAETCSRLMAEAEPNSPVLGCWGGYGEKPAVNIGEPHLQRLASLRGKWIVVTDGCLNLTVHSGLPFRKRSAPARPRPVLVPDKVYVCFNVTDGDNLQYLQEYFRSRQWWEDPNRGKVPISWSMNPLTAEILPDVLEYLQATATPNDAFVCGTAGIGLVTPSLYGKDVYADHQRVYREYLRMTARAMERAGLTAIHLGDTSSVPWTRADFDEWARGLPALEGVLGDYGPALGVYPTDGAFFVGRGTPVVRSITAPGDRAPHAGSAREVADAIRRLTPPQRPAFLHVCAINWFSSPTVLAEAAALLGPEYVPVLPSDLFALMRQHAGVNQPATLIGAPEAPSHAAPVGRSGP